MLWGDKHINHHGEMCWESMEIVTSLRHQMKMYDTLSFQLSNVGDQPAHRLWEETVMSLVWLMNSHRLAAYECPSLKTGRHLMYLSLWSKMGNTEMMHCDFESIAFYQKSSYVLKNIANASVHFMKNQCNEDQTVITWRFCHVNRRQQFTALHTK